MPFLLISAVLDGYGLYLGQICKFDSILAVYILA